MPQRMIKCKENCKAKFCPECRRITIQYLQELKLQGLKKDTLELLQNALLEFPAGEETNERFIATLIIDGLIKKGYCFVNQEDFIK